MDRYFDVVALVSNGGIESFVWGTYHYPRTPHLVGLKNALALTPTDAVFLATPTQTHVALTCQALEAGCHVFVEKPLALDPHDALRAVSIAEQHNLEVLVGYVYLFHPGFDFLRSAAPSESIRSLRFDWVRPHISGSLHEELLCHDLAVTIGLTGEFPERAVLLDSSSRTLRCQIQLPSGPSCESTIKLRDDVTKRRAVTVRYDDGTSYAWHDDRVYTLDDPGVNLLQPALDDPLSREVRAFRSAIEGTGPRMIDDRRLSVGIGRLLRDVGESTGT